MRLRNWCFTINNPSDEDLKEIEGLDCNYVVVGDETGSEGTRHYQGYVEFPRAYRLGALKKALSRAHLEGRKGSPSQAADYCKKDGVIVLERGELSRKRQGVRSDLRLVKTAIDQGSKIEEIADDHFEQWVRHNKAFLEYSRMKISKRDWVTEVTVLWGATGTGKSREAKEAGPAFWWNSDAGFNGYAGEELVVMDDFQGVSDLTLGQLLRLFDRYEYKLRVLYGVVQFAARRIIVTCHMHPRDWGYPAGRFDEIDRRLVQVRKLG